MLAKIGQAFSTWPDGLGWLICAGVMVVGFVVIAGVAKLGGLLAYRPKSGGHIRRFVTAIFVPSLGEETVFRVILWPSGEANAWGWMTLSLMLFVFWHVIEGTTFLKAHVAVLLNPYFLTCAGVLGLSCSIMVAITGSIWPAILTHALLVYLWQSFFGGLSLFEKASRFQKAPTTILPKQNGPPPHKWGGRGKAQVRN